MGAKPFEDPGTLIQRIAQGDRDAFGHFYDRYAPLVFTFAVRLLGDRFEAEDLLQEVSLQAWSQAGNYSPDRGSPEAWILNITRSRGIDRLRSLRRRKRGVVLLGGRGETPDSGTAESDARLTVHGRLAELPEAQRKVLEMAYFDGLTQSEIAARLGQPLGTVKTRMRAGLERLRGVLEGGASGGTS